MAFVSNFIASNNLPDVGFGKLTLFAPPSFFRVHVHHVINIGSKPQMVWINASSVRPISDGVSNIARVAYKQSFRYRAMFQFVRHAVSPHNAPMPKAESPVTTIPINRRSPKPAIIRASYIDFLPKSLRHWQISALPRTEVDLGTKPLHSAQIKLFSTINALAIVGFSFRKFVRHIAGCFSYVFRVVERILHHPQFNLNSATLVNP